MTCSTEWQSGSGSSRKHRLDLHAWVNWYISPNDFESGLQRVVEAGGDTDTNGAIVGAMLGARFGLTAIPERWLRRTDEIRAGRTPMEVYAERLVALAGDGSPPSPST